jgi:hypothetical protein
LSVLQDGTAREAHILLLSLSSGSSTVKHSLTPLGALPLTRALVNGRALNGGSRETKGKPKQYIRKNKTWLPKRSRNSTYTNTNWMKKVRNPTESSFR